MSFNGDTEALQQGEQTTANEASIIYKHPAHKQHCLHVGTAFGDALVIGSCFEAHRTSTLHARRQIRSSNLGPSETAFAQHAGSTSARRNHSMHRASSTRGSKSSRAARTAQRRRESLEKLYHHTTREGVRGRCCALEGGGREARTENGGWRMQRLQTEMAVPRQPITGHRCERRPAITPAAGRLETHIKAPAQPRTARRAANPNPRSSSTADPDRRT